MVLILAKDVYNEVHNFLNVLRRSFFSINPNSFDFDSNIFPLERGTLLNPPNENP
jgi:hypothetical protein